MSKNSEKLSELASLHDSHLQATREYNARHREAVKYIKIGFGLILLKGKFILGSGSGRKKAGAATFAAWTKELGYPEHNTPDNLIAYAQGAGLTHKSEQSDILQLQKSNALDGIKLGQLKLNASLGLSLDKLRDQKTVALPDPNKRGTVQPAAPLALQVQDDLEANLAQLILLDRHSQFDDVEGGEEARGRAIELLRTTLERMTNTPWEQSFDRPLEREIHITLDTTIEELGDTPPEAKPALFPALPLSDTKTPEALQFAEGVPGPDLEPGHPEISVRELVDTSVDHARLCLKSVKDLRIITEAIRREEAGPKPRQGLLKILWGAEKKLNNS